MYYQNTGNYSQNTGTGNLQFLVTLLLLYYCARIGEKMVPFHDPKFPNGNDRWKKNFSFPSHLPATASHRPSLFSCCLYFSLFILIIIIVHNFGRLFLLSLRMWPLACLDRNIIFWIYKQPKCLRKNTLETSPVSLAFWALIHQISN